MSDNWIWAVLAAIALFPVMVALLRGALGAAVVAFAILAFGAVSAVFVGPLALLAWPAALVFSLSRA